MLRRVSEEHRVGEAAKDRRKFPELRRLELLLPITGSPDGSLLGWALERSGWTVSLFAAGGSGAGRP